MHLLSRIFMKKYTLVGLVLLALPFLANAQPSIQSMLQAVGSILSSLVSLALGLAVVLFLFGVLKYVNAGVDEGSRAYARQLMIWGIVALFVMVSVTGLVALLSSTTQINPGGSLPIPTLPPVP